MNSTLQLLNMDCNRWLALDNKSQLDLVAMYVYGAYSPAAGPEGAFGRLSPENQARAAKLVDDTQMYCTNWANMQTTIASPQVVAQSYGYVPRAVYGYLPQAGITTVVKSSGALTDPLDPYYISPAAQLIILASTAVSAYHGFKRNHESVPWGFGWGILGAMFPIITPVVAFAQGYAKPAGRSNPTRRRRRR